MHGMRLRLAKANMTRLCLLIFPKLCVTYFLYREGQLVNMVAKLSLSSVITYTHSCLGTPAPE